MTDSELLASYDRSQSKTRAVVRAMYKEGVSLTEMVARLKRLGRNPERGMSRAFGTRSVELIPEAWVREYARRQEIPTNEPNREKTQSGTRGLISDWCRGCAYLLLNYGDPSCNYLHMEHRVRGCPAGDGCTERRTKRR